MNARADTVIPFIKICERKGTRVVNIKELFQALLIAAITALASVYVNQQVFVTKMESQDKNIEVLGEKIDGVSEQVQKIRNDFYVPRH